MIDFLDMDSNKLVISEFYENDKAGKYEYSASYQREKVWSEEKKSFLIDSILKNFPIPPVFFRMKIDPDTGVTKYDVIDGKQRLTTIKGFIEGNVCLPDDFGDDTFGEPGLNGAYFKDLDKFDKYKKQFWRYRIPIIFIETDDNDIIKDVFDRLNRNGEPLVPQELRHAKYGETNLYKQIEKLSYKYWKDILEKALETDRMEDKEFISELLFLNAEGKILSYTKDTLDELYKKWKEGVDKNIEEEFAQIMKYIEKLKLNYDKYKIVKVSHLYTIWCIGMLGYRQNIDYLELSKLLNSFYDSYSNKRDVEGTEEYRKGMSSATKGVSSRKKRVCAIISYCEKNGLKLTMDL